MSFQHISKIRKTFPKEPSEHKRPNRAIKWWTPLWSGLLVEPTAKHHKAMGTSIWLFLYFLTYANRSTGKLFRKRSTIASDLGLSPRTVNRWLQTLKKQGYVETKPSERSLIISINKWKPIVKR